MRSFTPANIDTAQNLKILAVMDRRSQNCVYFRHGGISLNLLCPAHTQRTHSANRKCTRAHRRLHSRTSQTNCTFTPDRRRVAAAQPAKVSACAPELQNERRHTRVHTHAHLHTHAHTNNPLPGTVYNGLFTDNQDLELSFH